MLLIRVDSNNVERMLETSMGSAEVTDITGTLTVLVPLVEQIRNEFGKCVSLGFLLFFFFGGGRGWWWWQWYI